MGFNKLLSSTPLCPTKLEPQKQLIHVLEIQLTNNNVVVFRVIPEDYNRDELPGDTTFNEVFSAFMYNNASMLLVNLKGSRCLDNKEGVSCAFYRKDILGLCSYAQLVSL